jgi:hypothetical protein
MKMSEETKAVLQQWAADAVQEPDGIAVALGVPSRQVARAEERKLEKDLTSAARLHEDAVRGLRKAQHMLAALVKEQGRIRFTRTMLESVGPKDGLDVKVDDAGNLVVTYLERGT